MIVSDDIAVAGDSKACSAVSTRVNRGSVLAVNILYECILGTLDIIQCSAYVFILGGGFLAGGILDHCYSRQRRNERDTGCCGEAFQCPSAKLEDPGATI